MENTSPSGFIAVQAAATHGPMYFMASARLPRRSVWSDPSPGNPREVAEGRASDHRHPEQRGVAVSAVQAAMRTCRSPSARSMHSCPRNAGLFVPKETVENCIRYVKQSQNPDGGFRYMLQGGEPLSRGRPPGWWRCITPRFTTPRRWSRALPICGNTCPRSSSVSRYSHYFMATIMPPRQCGSAAVRIGMRGILPFVTN